MRKANGFHITFPDTENGRKAAAFLVSQIPEQKKGVFLADLVLHYLDPSYAVVIPAVQSAEGEAPARSPKTMERGKAEIVSEIPALEETESLRRAETDEGQKGAEIDALMKGLSAFDEMF